MTRPSITATTVSVSNTALRPQRSENLDASIEWYPGRTSSFTAAVFSKDIKDYIVNNTARITAPMPEIDIGQDLVGLEPGVAQVHAEDLAVADPAHVGDEALRCGHGWLPCSPTTYDSRHATFNPFDDQGSGRTISNAVPSPHGWSAEVPVRTKPWRA